MIWHILIVLNTLVSIAFLYLMLKPDGPDTDDYTWDRYPYMQHEQDFINNHKDAQINE